MREYTFIPISSGTRIIHAGQLYEVCIAIDAHKTYVLRMYMNLIFRFVSCLVFVSVGLACGGGVPRAPDGGDDADAGLDADVCPDPEYGQAAEVPLTSSWGYFPMPRTASGYGVCDVETTGLVISETAPVFERTVGCGAQRFRSNGGVWLREASYDESGSLLGWHSLDDIPVQPPGGVCPNWEFTAGAWPPASCADERSWLCRTGECPRFLPATAETTGDLVAAFSATNTLAAMDAASDCTLDSGSFAGTPAWPADYVAVRTEGCGVVTYTLPYGPWSRFVVYSSASGAVIGAASIDDTPASLETASCMDQTVMAGAYPAPDCPANVVHYCTATPELHMQ